jgi:hypothetical protein
MFHICAFDKRGSLFISFVFVDNRHIAQLIIDIWPFSKTVQGVCPGFPYVQKETGVLAFLWDKKDLCLVHLFVSFPIVLSMGKKKSPAKMKCRKYSHTMFRSNPFGSTSFVKKCWGRQEWSLNHTNQKIMGWLDLRG